MAVLGNSGRLVLKRETPEECHVSKDQLDFANNLVTAICPGFWTGDKIEIDCLPVDDGDPPANTDGYASYFGSKWYLGGNRTQITANDDAFYKTTAEDYPDGQFGDDADFYVKPGDIDDGDEIPACIPGEWWIHIDQLGNISFYDSRCGALAGCLNNRVDLENIGEDFTIKPVEKEYQILCEIREWRLELEGPSVDTTSVSEKWGNAVKSLVTGGGSTEFFIDRKCFDDEHDNGLMLMKLLLLTAKGCKASAQFWMIDRGDTCGSDPCTGLIDGDLYYEADILITQNAINLRPAELVVGTAQFVTTGEIKLLETMPVAATPISSSCKA